jgi:hypothetical protein
MKAPLYRAFAKGTTAEAGTPRYSANWVTARRGWFKVYSDRVECGDWVIPNESVKDAVIFEARQWFVPVHILALTTESKTWQFGFNPWARVGQHLQFPVRIDRVQLRYSAFSIALRVGVLAYAGYWLFQTWTA